MKPIDSISDLVGLTLSSASSETGDLILGLEDGRSVRFYHDQDCCESVYIEDISGDLKDLIGSPLLKAEESTSSENPVGASVQGDEDFLWTFYHFATIKGYVTIRWYGTSNGYYSVSVDFEVIEKA